MVVASSDISDINASILVYTKFFHLMNVFIFSLDDSSVMEIALALSLQTHEESIRHETDTQQLPLIRDDELEEEDEDEEEFEDELITYHGTFTTLFFLYLICITTYLKCNKFWPVLISGHFNTPPPPSNRKQFLKTMHIVYEKNRSHCSGENFIPY